MLILGTSAGSTTHQRCAQTFPSISSLGVDAWALDFGLLGSDDVLLGNPHHYRDRRTEGMIEEIFKHLTPEELYQTTTNSLVFPTPTICQLMSMVRANASALRVAERLLTVPDLVSFWLTARKACETSHLANTRCYNPVTKTWAVEMLDKLGKPTHILPDIVEPGSILGTVLPWVTQETAWKKSQS